MRNLSRFLRTASRFRPRQLWERLRLTVKRRALVAGSRFGLAPGAWYRRAAPPLRENGLVAGPLIPRAAGAQPLPLAVDLVGTRWVVAPGMEWNPRELDRGTRLEKLNLHYMEYLHDLGPADARRMMRDWAERVPPYRPDYWKDEWNSYALSIRTVVWMEILSGRGVPEDSQDRVPILQSLAAQLRFLAMNLEEDIGGNHLMKNIRALARGSRFFAGPEAHGWARRAVTLLDRELRRQVLPDGMHFELSPSYHLQVLEDLLDVRRCLAPWATREFPRAGAVLAALDDCLQRMLVVADLFTHPDGLPSLFADGGLHMAPAIGELRAAAGSAFASGDGRLDGPWRLAHGGYCGLRTAGALLVVDCGPVGARDLPAHGHGDALAIEWSVGGRRLLVDAGVFEYHAGPRRAYARSTVAHNTATVDDADQSEFWSAFRVGRRANAACLEWRPDEARPGFHFVGEHDGYARLPGRPLHRRTIDARAESIRVVDEVRGGRGQPVRVRLLLSPDARIVEQVTTDSGGARLRLMMDTPWAGVEPKSALAGTEMPVVMSSSVPVRVESADWHPDFGTTVRTLRLVMEAGPAPTTVEWSVSVGEGAPRDA